MSTLAFKGTWNITKGRMKQALARLTRNHLQFVEGKTDELVGRIQKRKGEARTRRERGASTRTEAGPGGHR